MQTRLYHHKTLITASLASSNPVSYEITGDTSIPMYPEHIDDKFKKRKSLLQRMTSFFRESPPLEFNPIGLPLEDRKPSKFSIRQKIKTYGLPRVISWIFWRVMF